MYNNASSQISFSGCPHCTMLIVLVRLYSGAKVLVIPTAVLLAVAALLFTVNVHIGLCPINVTLSFVTIPIINS
jgi:hypothetical protein